MPAQEAQVRPLGWRREWQPTPAFTPGKPHGQSSLADGSAGGAEGQTRPSDQQQRRLSHPGPVCVGAFLWASAWLSPPPAPCDHMLLRDGIPGRPHLFPLTSLHSPQSGAESGCEIEQTGKKFSEHSRTCSQAARIRPGVEASGDEPGCLLWHLGSASHPDIDAACGRLGGLTWEEPRVMLSQLLEMYQPTSARGPFNGHIPHKDLTFA